MNPITRCSFFKSSASGTASGLLATAVGSAADNAAVQSLRTGQPACDLDTAKLVETLRTHGAYLPQMELSKTMTRAV